jgi:hypothetical protein
MAMKVCNMKRATPSQMHLPHWTASPQPGKPYIIIPKEYTGDFCIIGTYIEILTVTYSQSVPTVRTSYDINTYVPSTRSLVARGSFFRWFILDSWGFLTKTMNVWNCYWVSLLLFEWSLGISWHEIDICNLSIILRNWIVERTCQNLSRLL